MKAAMAIRLHGQPAGRRSLRIWGIAESGEPVPAEELKLLLFAEDPSTFYGAFADTWEEGPLSGVTLTGAAIGPFLRDPPANPLLRLEWGDGLEPLRFLLADAGNRPFRLAFSLREPEGDGHWALAAYLAGRDGDAAVPLDGRGRPLAPLPGHWRTDAQGAESLLQAWLKLMPALRDDADPARLRTALTDAEAWRFLTEWSGELTDWGADVWLPAWWRRLMRQKPKLKARLRRLPAGEPSLLGADRLLQFDWRLSIGDSELTEEEFVALAESGKTLHRIRGEWVALDPALAGKIRRIMQEARRRKGIPLRDVLLETVNKLEGGRDRHEAAEDGVEAVFEPDASLAAWLNTLARLGETAELPVPAGFRGELRPYQKRGFSWLASLHRHGFGGCLADDMGLGKTVQYIAYLLHLLETERAGPSLLICPTSLIGNWQKELARFAPGCRVLVHYGAGRARDPEAFRGQLRACDLVLTTYMTALLDRPLLQAVDWHSLCLDEAQHLRNAHTKQAAAIRRLPAVHRVALTGTPLENRPADLWSIIDFVNPGYLGSLAAFERQFGRTAASGRGAETLRRIVRPFLLRRMKSDPRIAPDLPEKIESNLYVPLTKEQAALYEGVLDRLWNSLEKSGGMARRGRILSAITRLKQICGHPALYWKETPDRNPRPDPALSNKSALLLEMVADLRARGESCLVFTQYAAMGALLQRMLENALREPVLYLHGGTPKAERERLVEAFRDGGVFVLSLRAGGTGLNLTAASHVFHYDRWWNPAVENQATDRAHRIGQQSTVHVHKLIALGTLEEKIDELIGKKRDLMQQITDFDERSLSELDDGRLRELVELRRNWVDG